MDHSGTFPNTMPIADRGHVITGEEPWDVVRVPAGHQGWGGDLRRQRRGCADDGSCQDEDEVEVLAIRDENKIVGASSDCAKDLEVLRIVNQEEVCLVAQFLIATKQGWIYVQKDLKLSILKSWYSGEKKVLICSKIGPEKVPILPERIPDVSFSLTCW